MRKYYTARRGTNGDVERWTPVHRWCIYECLSVPIIFPYISAASSKCRRSDIEEVCESRRDLLRRCRYLEMAHSHWSSNQVKDARINRSITKKTISKSAEDHARSSVARQKWADSTQVLESRAIVYYAFLRRLRLIPIDTCKHHGEWLQTCAWANADFKYFARVL